MHLHYKVVLTDASTKVLDLKFKPYYDDTSEILFQKIYASFEYSPTRHPVFQETKKRIGLEDTLPSSEFKVHVVSKLTKIRKDIETDIEDIIHKIQEDDTLIEYKYILIKEFSKESRLLLSLETFESYSEDVSEFEQKAKMLYDSLVSKFTRDVPEREYDMMSVGLDSTIGVSKLTLVSNESMLNADTKRFKSQTMRFVFDKARTDARNVCIAINNSGLDNPYFKISKSADPKKYKKYIVTSGMTYTNFKGFLFIVTVTSGVDIEVYLYQDGRVKTVCLTDTSLDFVVITEYCMSAVMLVLEKVNEHKDIYNISIPITEALFNVSSVSAYIHTPAKYVNQDSLSRFLNSNNRFFNVKDVQTEDALSLVSTVGSAGVYVSDDAYNVNSSHIRISNAKSFGQVSFIIHALYASSELAGGNVDTRKLLKTKSKLQELKKTGVAVRSTECQKERQPILTSGFVSPNSITYNDNIYTCDNPTYPYPGFTKKNKILCCFKNPQNTVLPDEQYSLSNIQYNDNVIFKKFDSSAYYTIDKLGIETQITDNDLIIQLDMFTDGWSGAMTIADLKARVRRMKSFAFKFEIRSDGRIVIDNVPSSEQKLSKHVITTEKQLNYMQLGMLTGSLDLILKNVEGDYRRFGASSTRSVNKNLLNAVSLGLYGEDTSKVETVYQYIYKNPKTDIEGVISKIRTVIGINIILVIVPELVIDNAKFTDHSKARVSCYTEYDITLPYLIIQMNGTATELIVQLRDPTPQTMNSIQCTFDRTSQIIETFYDIILKSCVVSENYPTDYKYKKLKSANDFSRVVVFTNPSGIETAKYGIVRSENGKDILVPIRETNASELSNTTKCVKESALTLATASEYIKTGAVGVIGVVKSKLTDLVIGLVTEYGMSVPVSPGDAPETLKDLSVYDSNSSVDSKLIDSFGKYIRNLESNRDTLHDIKVLLVQIFSKAKTSRKLKAIIQDISDISKGRRRHMGSRVVRIEKIADALADALGADTEDQDDFLIFALQDIANDIINNNSQNCTLVDTLVSIVDESSSASSQDTHDTQDIVLMSIQDISNWLVIHK